MKKKVIIWGVGDIITLVKNRCMYLDYNVLAFYDTNIKKQNKIIEGVKVLTKDNFIRCCNDDPEIAIIVGTERSSNDIIKSFNELFSERKPELITLSALESAYIERARAGRQDSYLIDFKKAVWPWLSNIMSEVDFWCGVSKEILRGITKRQHDEFICHRVMEIVKPGDTVFDVGCGLFSQYGTKLLGGGYRSQTN